MQFAYHSGIKKGVFMQISTDLLLSTSGSDSSKRTNYQAVEAEFAEYLKEDSPEELLRQITENGVQSLLEHKIDQLKKEATERAMAARGVTQDDLAAMEPAERAALMETIMAEVREQIKQAMQEQMKREANLDVMFQSGPMESQTLAQVQQAQDIQSLL